MYQTIFLILGLSLLMTTGAGVGVEAKEAGGRQKMRSLPGGSMGDSMGLYLNADDFLGNKLSYPGDCGSGGYKIKTHELFQSSGMTIVYKGRKQVFSKDELYGYRDCKDRVFRFYDHAAYRILDTAWFYLYSYTKLVQGEKIARPQEAYYFSLKAASRLYPLTIGELQNAFTGNARFRHGLESQFRSDKELIAYDGVEKAYKIKWLYRDSIK